MDVGVVKNDKAVAIDLGGQKVTASITSTGRPFLAVAINIPKHNEVGREQRRD